MQELDRILNSRLRDAERDTVSLDGLRDRQDGHAMLSERGEGTGGILARLPGHRSDHGDQGHALIASCSGFTGMCHIALLVQRCTCYGGATVHSITLDVDAWTRIIQSGLASGTIMLP